MRRSRENAWTVKVELFGGVLFSVTLVPTIFTENRTHRKFRYNRYCITSRLTWKTGFAENFTPPNRQFWRIPKILHRRTFLLFAVFGVLMAFFSFLKGTKVAMVEKVLSLQSSSRFWCSVCSRAGSATRLGGTWTRLEKNTGSPGQPGHPGHLSRSWEYNTHH